MSGLKITVEVDTTQVRKAIEEIEELTEVIKKAQETYVSAPMGVRIETINFPDMRR